MNIYQNDVFRRGFGTFPLTGERLSEAVKHALEAGYRAFDTAQWYGNEADLGAVLSNAGVPRESLLITTKVHPENMTPERFMDSVKRSVDQLGGIVDVLLLHWPPGDDPVEPSLQLLQEAKAQGFARHLGVSNYTVAQMRAAASFMECLPVVNQIEFHPLLNQDKLLAASTQTGIPLCSYCSIARGEIFKYPLLAEIGKKYAKSAAQVTLRWILQKGLAMNTMSTRPENIVANFNIVDFVLTPEEVTKIDALTHTGFRISNSDVVPYAPTWD